MKPGDHPEFFRFPPPEGRSRESTIRLDAEGHFWHEDNPVAHAKLAQAMHGWVGRHPDDGRYILTNGYDWTYFTVDDAPYFVRAVRIEADCIRLLLSDGSDENLEPQAARVGDGDALYAIVKRAAPGGPYEAKFTPHAQASLGPALVEATPTAPALCIGGRTIPIGEGAERSER